MRKKPVFTKQTIIELNESMLLTINGGSAVDAQPNSTGLCIRPTTIVTNKVF